MNEYDILEYAIIGMVEHHPPILTKPLSDVVTVFHEDIGIWWETFDFPNCQLV
jgi:hypothetical protein